MMIQIEGITTARKIVILSIALLVILSACGTNQSREPDPCSLCDNLPCHAPCIINLGTGENLELSVYELHPFTAGELAEEQRTGYFCFIQGAGISGHKLGGKSVTVTIPTESKGLSRQYFCTTCLDLLASYANQGYVLADLKNPKNPIIYSICKGSSFSFRCYDISVQKSSDTEGFVVTIIGTLEQPEKRENRLTNHSQDAVTSPK